MSHVFLEASKSIDPEKEWSMSYLTSIENCYGELHSHDFFELLLMLEGNLINEVNGIETILSKGSLVFFRPDDLHQLRQYKDTNCQFINLTFLGKTVDDLWNYMGEDLKASKFIASGIPPCLTLTENHLNEVKSKINRLNTIPSTSKQLSRTALRTMLVEFYFIYLPLVWQEAGYKLPRWLERLCEDIRQEDNFKTGLEAMVHLSGRNHSYLCRTFKRYFKITPTEYINLIRLDYAENLLLNTDISITEICYETGFGSLSHFYSLFEQRYGQTPLKYRKKFWNSTHRWT